MLREWDAAAYDSLPLPHLRWGRRTLERLSFAGDETVLEAGCGTGRDTEALLDRLPHGRVVAVDGSARMLQRLRERLERAGFTDVEVALVDDPARLEPGEQFHSYLAIVVLGAHLDRIPPAEHRAFVEAVAARLDEPVVDYVRLTFTATRAG
jgi:SAM-dependent methyltransferase